jgi:hypothetical protein
MELFIKIIPLRAGISEPVGQPRIVACPADVGPDTILSFLTQQLGEVIDTLWTSTERHQRVGAGWLFPGPEAASRRRRSSSRAYLSSRLLTDSRPCSNSKPTSAWNLVRRSRPTAWTVASSGSRNVPTSQQPTISVTPESSGDVRTWTRS